MAYFVATTEKTSVEGLARLLRDNMWKLYKLPESVMLDRGLQFAAELIKKLNRILRIKTKLSMSFYLQTNGKTEQINQKLEQYFRFFMDYKQKDWPEQLLSAEFVVNNKVYSVTKVSSFIVNYNRELRMGIDIRRKEKVEKATEFAERMKKVLEEAEVMLKKVQKKIKQQTNKESKKTKEQKKIK